MKELKTQVKFWKYYRVCYKFKNKPKIFRGDFVYNIDIQYFAKTLLVKTIFILPD